MPKQSLKQQLKNLISENKRFVDKVNAVDAYLAANYNRKDYLLKVGKDLLQDDYILVIFYKPTYMVINLMED